MSGAGGDSWTTDASYVFDVFSTHDYSSRTGHDGLRSATLGPPVDAAGKPYLVGETIGIAGMDRLVQRNVLAMSGRRRSVRRHREGRSRRDQRQCPGPGAVSGYWHPPGAENDAIATLPYVNATAGRNDHTVYVFSASVAIVPGREVSAVTLPPNGANPPAGRTQGMHLFTLAVG